jgi:outer membrane protein OmpA-like peptidoglycan-associated protein
MQAIHILLSLCLWLAAPALAAAGAGQNLLTLENGARVIGFSSEFGGWDAANMVPALARLQEPGVDIQDFVWCTADNAPFPHWVLFELKQKQWLTTFVFNNALKEEAAYPGISARQLEVWVGLEEAGKLKKVAAFQLERNKTGQSVRIEPLQARWIKFVITSNWGHPTWTEMNASAALDDGSRPANFAAELKKHGKVDIYGIYFDFGSARLRAESRPALEEIARFHKANPAQALHIEGHTDNVGTKKYNQDLSMQRAQAVIAELERMGASAGRFIPVGYGADQPVAGNDTEAGRAKNRRVTVRLAK